MDERTFGQLLNKALEKKGISKRGLGKLIGVSDVILIKYSKGLSYPKTANLKKLCRVLKFDLDFNELTTLIKSERDFRKTKNSIGRWNASYSYLRKLLLERYSIKEIFEETFERKEDFLSKNEVEEIIKPYPIHPIEKVLFQEIYNYLAELNKVPTGNLAYDPIDYFNKLTDSGKKKQIDNTKIVWAYLSTTLAFKIGGRSLEYRRMSLENFNYQDFKEKILSFYFQNKSDTSREEIQKRIFLDYFHTIEKKLWEEINSRLPETLKTDTFEQFALLADKDLEGRLREVNLRWSYRLKDNFLSITFKNNKTVIFKLIWQEHSK